MKLCEIKINYFDYRIQNDGFFEYIGHSIIKDNCYIGPAVNIPNRITIHSNSKLSVGATITRDVPKDSIYSRNFAVEHQKFIQHLKSISE